MKVFFFLNVFMIHSPARRCQGWTILVPKLYCFMQICINHVLFFNAVAEIIGDLSLGSKALQLQNELLERDQNQTK
jgi:hypothetical protein